MRTAPVVICMCIVADLIKIGNCPSNFVNPPLTAHIQPACTVEETLGSTVDEDSVGVGWRVFTEDGSTQSSETLRTDNVFRDTSLLSRASWMASTASGRDPAAHYGEFSPQKGPELSSLASGEASSCG